MRLELMRAPLVMEKTVVSPSVLDGLMLEAEDEDENDQHDNDQHDNDRTMETTSDYHQQQHHHSPIKNGVKRKSIEFEIDDDVLESDGKRAKLDKKLEVKGLLGNSLGSYWNDGTMIVEKRRRKQVVRFTQDKKDEDDEESPKRRKKLRNSTPDAEKLNLKKRARQVKAESDDVESGVNPYTYFEDGTLDSTLNTTATEGEDDDEDDLESNVALKGAKKRKCHTPYTKSPISTACHMARKPVQNFNLCPYKQPSRLLKDCAQFLLRDHSSIPLILALDVTELVHVSEYKALLLQQSKSTKLKRNKNMPQKPKDIDNIRPGYSRAKEDLKQFLCSVTVERAMHQTQRKAGRVDPEYQLAKRHFLEFLDQHQNNQNGENIDK